MNVDKYRLSNTIIQLRQVVNTVNRFTDVDECSDFITGFTEEKIFMIVSDSLNQIVILIVRDIPQISCIYIFGKNKIQHEQWVKVKSVFEDITPICQAFKQVVQENCF